MVVLTEVTSVFWGVILEGGKKKYTQTTEKAVHVSMAALDPTKPCGDGPISVKIEHNSGSYVLCTLLKDKLYQQPLNLEFAAGEEISFIVHGTGSVHLSGFVMQEDNYSDYGDGEDLVSEDMESDDEEDESDEDEAVIRPGKKRQLVDAKRASKRAKITLADLEDDEDDSDDDDFIVHEAEETNDDEDDDDDDDDEDDDDEEEEEESEDEEPPKPVGKKNGKAAVVDAKINSTTPTSKDKAQNTSVGKTKTATTPNAKGTDKTQNTPKQQAPAAAAQPKEDGDSQGKKKKKKKNKKNKAENQQQTPNSPAPSTSAAPAPASKVPAKRVAEGGVVIEDVKQGHGPEAQLGKKVSVYYTGRLLNGKVFDCCTSGNGFKFKLGKKEVITGWDVGVKGMKVGGKRTLVIPPKMGYGSSAAGPIPANSTLVFDVELKAVN